jgi:predicted dehydrogenase
VPRSERLGVEKRYTDYYELLEDPIADAVPINPPIHEHARMSIAGLKAGKRVASTVPAATSIEELEQIVAAQAASGQNTWRWLRCRDALCF